MKEILYTITVIETCIIDQRDYKYLTDFCFNKEIWKGKIMVSGVMSMPALVINDKVVSMGRIVTVNEIIEMIKQ